MKNSRRSMCSSARQTNRGHHTATSLRLSVAMSVPNAAARNTAKGILQKKNRRTHTIAFDPVLASCITSIMMQSYVAMLEKDTALTPKLSPKTFKKLAHWEDIPAVLEFRSQERNHTLQRNGSRHQDVRRRARSRSTVDFRPTR